MDERRILHVDASQGASGDMILGALVGLGVPLSKIRRGLAALPVAGYRLVGRPLTRCALQGTKVDVRLSRHAPHHGRSWRELKKIVDTGALPTRVRTRALAIFRRLVEAEAEVHGSAPDRVHLHEVGDTDAIVDVVGACLGIELLAPDRVVVSRLTTGFGQVRCSHGVYPVPAPVTALLLRGLPVQAGDLETERLTPTGAAILAVVADAWGPLPPMALLAVGYGAGDRDLAPSPNMLRMALGREPDAVPVPGGGTVEIDVLECTLDDATPQAVAHAAERLLEAGALDVSTTAVTMKKGRSGHHLTVLGRPAVFDALLALLIEETSTLGVRFHRERRVELERSSRRVRTPYGTVSVKIGSWNGRELKAWPEFEDCRTLAARRGVRLIEVQRAALAAWSPRPVPRSRRA